MPRYMTLARIFIEPRGASGGARIVPAGQEVEYDGAADPTLFPLDDEARAARALVRAKRNPRQRIRDDIVMRRALRGMPKHIRMRLGRIAAEAGRASA